MFIQAILLPLLAFNIEATSQSQTANSNIGRSSNLRSGPCDDSFPLVTPHGYSGRRLGRHERRLVAIHPNESGEYYETGEYYAPLCPDGRHIDIRKLIRCNGGSCFNEELNQCTFECMWNKPSPEPTRRPTPSPSRAPKITDEPLLLSLKGLPKKYRLSKAVRATIIRYMSDRLKFDLKELGLGLELIEVTYPGRLPGKPYALPLNIKVKGPPDISEYALSYIMQTMNDVKYEITENIKNLDYGTGQDEKENFKDVSLSIDTYSYADISEGDTPSPSESPTTQAPRLEPVPVSPVKPKSDSMILEDEVTNSTPWWVWLIVGLIILLCFISCCCYCWRRRRESQKTDPDLNKGRQINIHLQNHLRPRHRDILSVQSKQTRKSRHHPQPRSVADHSRRGSVRTTRTHKTRAPRPSHSRAPAPTPEVAVPVIPKERVHDETPTKTLALPEHAWDNESAVSALASGYDPPEEHALVLYEANSQARDPTSYTNRAINPNQTEPEGDKVDRKKSMFADAQLIHEVHREREEAEKRKKSKRKVKKRRTSMDRIKKSLKWKTDQSEDMILPREHVEPPEEAFEDGIHSRPIPVIEPEGDKVDKKKSLFADSLLTADEFAAMQAKPRKKKGRSKKTKSSTTRTNRGMASMIGSSMVSKRTEISELSHDSHSESPSLMTNHNPPGSDGYEASRAASNNLPNNGYSVLDPETQASQTNSLQPKFGSRKKGQKKNESIFASVKRRSSNFMRDAVCSDDSLHIESEGEDTGFATYYSKGNA